MYVLFLGPLVAFLLITNLIPLGYSTYLALTDWQLADSGASASWVGLENFKRVLGDDVFRDAFVLSLEYASVCTAVQVVLGTLVAYMIVGDSWPLRIARALIIVPMFIPGVVVGTIWRIMLHPEAGIVNWALGLVGLPGLAWFTSPDTALWSVILVDVWYFTPFVIVLVVAGIASVPAEPIKAAMVDGASRWQVFRHVLLPLLAPVITIAILFRFLLSFFVLDHIYTTTSGGPGFATNLMSFHLYKQGLSFFNLPYTAAASWLMIAFALVVILVLYGIRRTIERRAGI
jgi:multiple sugar transport system permease protein